VGDSHQRHEPEHGSGTPHGSPRLHAEDGSRWSESRPDNLRSAIQPSPSVGGVFGTRADSHDEGHTNRPHEKGMPNPHAATGTAGNGGAVIRLELRRDGAGMGDAGNYARLPRWRPQRHNLSGGTNGLPARRNGLRGRMKNLLTKSKQSGSVAPP